jgi:double-stranded uracil-DNA glycosylase
MRLQALIRSMLEVMKSESFAPIGAQTPHILILGSLPGQASLQAGQYYAHPRNAFWPIIAAVFGFSHELSYPQRILAISERKIALWDVVQSAVRQGSLDASMKAQTIVVNDLAALLRQSQLRAIALNGAAAAKLFRKQHQVTQAEVLELPSTSPAHAAMSFADKLQAWMALERYQ